MHREDDYIELREALRDFLRESRITVNDLLAAMDEEKQSLLDALKQRVSLSEEHSRILERSLSSKQLNLLLFILQAFYITNLSGLYKGRPICPAREDVIRGGRATSDGLKQVGRALGIHIDL